MIELDLRGEIRRFIIDVLGYGDVSVIDSDEDSLIDRRLIDSTDILELIVFLENRFEIRVEDEEVVPENFDSVSRLYEFVTAKLGRAAADQGRVRQSEAGFRRR
jgi:acyl carrier protein